MTRDEKLEQIKNRRIVLAPEPQSQQAASIGTQQFQEATKSDVEITPDALENRAREMTALAQKLREKTLRQSLPDTYPVLVDKFYHDLKSLGHSEDNACNLVFACALMSLAGVIGAISRPQR